MNCKIHELAGEATVLLKVAVLSSSKGVSMNRKVHDFAGEATVVLKVAVPLSTRGIFPQELVILGTFCSLKCAMQRMSTLQVIAHSFPAG